MLFHLLTTPPWLPFDFEGDSWPLNNFTLDLALPRKFPILEFLVLPESATGVFDLAEAALLEFRVACNLKNLIRLQASIWI